MALFCHTQIQQSSGLNRKSDRETGGGYMEMCSQRGTQGKTSREKEKAEGFTHERSHFGCFFTGDLRK